MFLSDFAKSSVGLPELLNISDDRLMEIGVSYPFQRKRIQTGLWQFHQYDWSPWLLRFLVRPPMKYSRLIHNLDSSSRASILKIFIYDLQHLRSVHYLCRPFALLDRITGKSSIRLSKY